jgi:hypothetical protein
MPAPFTGLALLNLLYVVPLMLAGATSTYKWQRRTSDTIVLALWEAEERLKAEG